MSDETKKPGLLGKLFAKGSLEEAAGKTAPKPSESVPDYRPLKKSIDTYMKGKAPEVVEGPKAAPPKRVTRRTGGKSR